MRWYGYDGVLPETSMAECCQNGRQAGRSLLLEVYSSHRALQEPVTVSVYGANGRFVKQRATQQQAINLMDGLSKGMYLVSAELGGVRLMKRMLISL